MKIKSKKNIKSNRKHSKKNVRKNKRSRKNVGKYSRKNIKKYSRKNVIIEGGDWYNNNNNNENVDYYVLTLKRGETISDKEYKNTKVKINPPEISDNIKGR